MSPVKHRSILITTMTKLGYKRGGSIRQQLQAHSQGAAIWNYGTFIMVLSICGRIEGENASMEIKQKKRQKERRKKKESTCKVTLRCLL